MHDAAKLALERGPIEARSPDPVMVLAAVPAWWARRARLAGLPAEWQDWRRALNPAPVPLPVPASDHLAAVSPYALGSAYACALPRAERFEHGRHYTPKALGDALWTEIERANVATPNAPTFDPSCGAGALLLRPLRRFVGAAVGEPVKILADVKAGFGGIDNDPLAVWLGSAILAAELLPVWARMPERDRELLPELLTQGDGLAVRRESAGIVVMNPPYGRAAIGPETRKRWADSLYGHANWYGLFLHAGIERVQDGGVVAAVLPASFLGGAYYQRLRLLLAEHAPLVRLRLIDDRSGVFASGVLQETCLAVFHKGARPQSVACSTQSVNGRVRSVSLGRAALSADTPDLPWLLPRSRNDRALVRAAGKHSHRLRDYGWKASTGPLVWNRHKSKISADRAADAVPILWAADLEPGRVRRSPARENQRWLRLRERDEFMRLTEPAVLVQRTTAPEQPRRLVAAPLTGDVLRAEWGGTAVVENHVNVLRCDSGGPLSPELLTALLNASTFDRLFRCMTGTVAVSAYELEALPLPAPEVLREWSDLTGDALALAVAAAFA